MQNQPSGIRDNKCQLGVGRAHTIHPGGGFADAHRAMLLYQLTFQSQHIAGHNLAAETGIFYPAKQGNLSTAFRQAQRCLLYTSPSPRDAHESRMPSSA